MYCEKCGQQLPDHATFCGKCGVRVSEGTNYFQVQEEKPVKASANKGGVRHRGIIGICLLVGIIIVGGVFLLRRNGNGDSAGNVVQGDEVDIVTFGNYEQDNNHSNGAEPLEWIVLDRQDDKVLLLSRYVIDCQQYHEKYYDITWAECDLRNWLNSTFYESAFNEEQQWQIIETEVLNPDNEEYGTPGGVTTYDKVFLLSLTEADSYFSSSEDRKAIATAYAMDSNLWTNYENCAHWWLRSPGYSSNYAADVYSNGAVDEGGSDVNGANIGVRPALWVRIEE